MMTPVATAAPRTAHGDPPGRTDEHASSPAPASRARRISASARSSRSTTRRASPRPQSDRARLSHRSAWRMWASIPSGITLGSPLGPHARRRRREMRLEPVHRLLLKAVEMRETDSEFAGDPPRLLLLRDHRAQDALLALRKALDRGRDLLDHNGILHAREAIRGAEVLHQLTLRALDHREHALAVERVEDATSDPIRRKRAEPHAPAGVVALHGFDEADGTLLDHVHDDLPAEAQAHRQLEDERLVRLDEACAAPRVAAPLVPLPQARFLSRGKQGELAQPVQIVGNHRAVHYRRISTAARRRSPRTNQNGNWFSRNSPFPPSVSTLNVARTLGLK